MDITRIQTFKLNDLLVPKLQNVQLMLISFLDLKCENLEIHLRKHVTIKIEVYLGFYEF